MTRHFRNKNHLRVVSNLSNTAAHRQAAFMNRFSCSLKLFAICAVGDSVQFQCLRSYYAPRHYLRYSCNAVLSPNMTPR